MIQPTYWILEDHKETEWERQVLTYIEVILFGQVEASVIEIGILLRLCEVMGEGACVVQHVSVYTYTYICRYHHTQESIIAGC